MCNACAVASGFIVMSYVSDIFPNVLNNAGNFLSKYTWSGLNNVASASIVGIDNMFNDFISLIPSMGALASSTTYTVATCICPLYLSVC